MNKIKLILPILVFAFALSGCMKYLDKTNDALAGSTCDMGRISACHSPGEHALYSEVSNQKTQENTYTSSVSKATKGFYWLGMACFGDYNSASQLYTYARARYLLPCYARAEDIPSDPFEVEYCFSDGQKVFQLSNGGIGRYLPSPKACAYRYYVQNELVDELLERSNDKRAQAYAKSLQDVHDLNDDEFVRMAVLWAPSIPRDESTALKELKLACQNIKLFENIGYNASATVCQTYQISKEANQYLCSRYKHEPSCKAIRSAK